MSRNRLFGLLAACMALLITMPAIAFTSPRANPANYRHVHHGHRSHWRGHHVRPHRPHGRHRHGPSLAWASPARAALESAAWARTPSARAALEPAAGARSSSAWRAAKQASRARSRASPSSPRLASFHAVRVPSLCLSAGLQPAFRASIATMVEELSHNRSLGVSQMPTVPFFIVDVFAEEKYHGNQLAVFTDAAALTGAEMQRFAKEMHFSESTFLLSPRAARRRLRRAHFHPAGGGPVCRPPDTGNGFRDPAGNSQVSGGHPSP